MPVCVNVCVFTGNSEFPEVRKVYFFILDQNRVSIGNLRVETTLLINHHKNAFNIKCSAFPSTYFYAYFGLSHKKMLNGNAKMRIISKNAHKKHMHTFE